MSRIIPTYQDGEWSTTEFKSDNEFREYLELIFKEPGKYNFTKYYDGLGISNAD